MKTHTPASWRSHALISAGWLLISLWYLGTGPTELGYVFLALTLGQAAFALNAYAHSRPHVHHKARPHHPRYHSHFHV